MNSLNPTSGTQVVLENLPVKATVDFQVTAYNAARDSAASEVVGVPFSAPITRQPVVGAVLLPSASAGIWALLQYFR